VDTVVFITVTAYELFEHQTAAGEYDMVTYVLVPVVGVEGTLSLTKALNDPIAVVFAEIAVLETYVVRTAAVLSL